MAKTTTRTRQQRGLATRRKILDAGRVAFGAMGYDRTNLVADVLEPAGVSTGSFYHQFPDKAALFEAVIAESTEQVRDALSEIHLDPGLDGLSMARRSYDLFFELVEGNEDLFRLQMRDRDHPDPRVRKPLQEMRAGWVGRLADDFGVIDQTAGGVPMRDVAELVTSLATGAMVAFLEAPPADRPAVRERLVDNLAVFTLGGIYGLQQRALGQAGA